VVAQHASCRVVQVEPAMKQHPFAIETKMDGERMLCHKIGSKVGED
jgi:ATP-dependent DNA ligase